MRKIALALVVFLVYCNCAYSFWIWSPRTKQFRNPRYSAKRTPILQIKRAFKLYQRGNYKRAYFEFKKMLKKYPDAKEAAEAQYFLGRCYEKLGKPYEAFLAYQNVVDKYPNSKRISKAVERQFRIGESFMDEPKKFFGINKYDFLDHPTIEIFNKIVEKSSPSPCAPLAQYKLAVLLMQLSRYEESVEAFQKVIDTFPSSEWALAAKYQLAIATSKSFKGTDYDSTSLEDATGHLDDFIREHPEAQATERARDHLSQLEEKEAKKVFETAQFYESQRKYRSAMTYYLIVVNKYSYTSFGSKAKAKVKELEGKNEP